MLTSVVQVAAVPAIKKKDPIIGQNLKKKNKTSKNFELEQNFHWNSVTKINSPQLNCQGDRLLKVRRWQHWRRKRRRRRRKWRHVGQSTFWGNRPMSEEVVKSLPETFFQGSLSHPLRYHFYWKASDIYRSRARGSTHRKGLFLLRVVGSNPSSCI